MKQTNDQLKSKLKEQENQVQQLKSKHMEAIQQLVKEKEKEISDLQARSGLTDSQVRNKMGNTVHAQL